MPLKKNQWVCGNCFRVNRVDFFRYYDCGISREESDKGQAKNLQGYINKEMPKGARR